MKLIINDEEKDIAGAISVKDVVDSMKLVPEKIVVELNHRILKTEEWKSSSVKDNDRIEIVSFVGGG